MKRTFVFVAVTMHVVAAMAQTDPESSVERQRAIVAEIEAEQSANGPLSAGLIDPLTSLVLFYEEQGDEALALVTTERVLQVIRANFGIYSVEQAPMLRRLMDSAEAHGDYVAAWDIEQDLIELARRNPDDLRAVPIFRDAAESRIDVLDRYIAGEYPPEIELGCYFAGELARTARGCSAGSQQRAARTILCEAHENYVDAIQFFAANDRYDSDELRELEWDIINSTMAHGRYLGGVREYCDWHVGDRDYCVQYHRGSVGCRLVEDRLYRLHDYDVRSSAPLQQRVDSLVRIADWKLYCKWNAYAHNAYEAVLALLEAEGAPQSEFDRVFAPETPVLLPAFVDSILVTEASSPDAAYVDVAFEVTRFGTARGIKILSGKKTSGAEDIERVIKRGRFRPFADNGELVDSPRFEVRYFVVE